AVLLRVALRGLLAELLRLRANRLLKLAVHAPLLPEGAAERPQCSDVPDRPDRPEIPDHPGVPALSAERPRLADLETGGSWLARHERYGQGAQLRRGGVQPRLRRRQGELDVVPLLAGLLHDAGQVLNADLVVLSLAGPEAVLRPPGD